MQSIFKYLPSRLFLVSHGISFLILLSIASCDESTVKTRFSPPLELRQLVQQESSSKVSSGYYFLVGGAYDSYDNKITVVKAFAKVEGQYRFIQMPIEDIRIKIDSTLEKPFIRLRYTDHKDINANELLSDDWQHKIYEITCPERLLPEKLLPINL